MGRGGGEGGLAELKVKEVVSGCAGECRGSRGRREGGNTFVVVIISWRKTDEDRTRTGIRKPEREDTNSRGEGEGGG